MSEHNQEYAYAFGNIDIIKSFHVIILLSNIVGNIISHSKMHVEKSDAVGGICPAVPYKHTD